MRNKITTIIILLITTISLGVGSWSCAPKGYSGKPESVTLGGLTTDADIMFFIAEDQHYFSENGINFTFKTYDTGVQTIADLLNNKLDIAGSTEYPLITNALAKENISIITNIDKSFVLDLIGLTDKGIKNVADIKGKRIGLPLGTINQFYLGRFLELNGMDIQDVSLVNQSPGQAVDALTNGSVGAVVTREPYETQIRKQYPNGIVSWSVQSSQAVYSVLICRNDWIKQNPDLVKRFMNSLAQAERYIAQHPTEAKAILQKRYQYSNDYITKIWPNNQFSLSLDQSLIVALEDEARWMIKNNLTVEKQVPFFNEYIYTDALKAVKPEAVNIIR
jgi:ABC-type nitrate/sulfonate/bicarbonate transport system substrate-binding protein